MDISGGYKRKSPWSVSASRAKGACTYLTTKRRLGHSMNQFCLSTRSRDRSEKGLSSIGLILDYTHSHNRRFMNESGSS